MGILKYEVTKTPGRGLSPLAWRTPPWVGGQASRESQEGSEQLRPVWQLAAAAGHSVAVQAVEKWPDADHNAREAAQPDSPHGPAGEATQAVGCRPGYDGKAMDCAGAAADPLRDCRQTVSPEEAELRTSWLELIRSLSTTEQGGVARQRLG